MHPCRVKGAVGGGVGDGKRVTHVPGPYRRVHIRREAGETDREKAGRPRKKSKIPRIEAGLLWFRSYAEAIRGITRRLLTTTADPLRFFLFFLRRFILISIFVRSRFHGRRSTSFERRFGRRYREVQRYRLWGNSVAILAKAWKGHPILVVQRRGRNISR